VDTEAEAGMEAEVDMEVEVRMGLSGRLRQLTTLRTVYIGLL
jgi:hypothetical protein